MLAEHGLPGSQAVRCVECARGALHNHVRVATPVTPQVLEGPSSATGSLGNNCTFQVPLLPELDVHSRGTLPVLPKQ